MLFDQSGTNLRKFSAKAVNPWSPCSFRRFCEQTDRASEKERLLKMDVEIWCCYSKYPWMFMWFRNQLDLPSRISEKNKLCYFCRKRIFAELANCCTFISRCDSGKFCRPQQDRCSVALLCEWRHAQLGSQSGPCQLWFMSFIPGKINLASSLPSLF